ncbi:NAD(P)-binding protein [Poronia punctata]|nr:NAD(P)-binding protein [Poronia punctata]
MSFDGSTTSEEVIKHFTPQIASKTFVIIGAGYPSIGSQIATYLSSSSSSSSSPPGKIIIASRTASKVDPVLATISNNNPRIKTSFIQVDVTDHESVRSAAPEILQEVGPGQRIDVLIYAAGAMALKDYTVDKQGIEYQLSANHVGCFLLTNLLAPNFERFVVLTSSGYRLTPFRFDDYNFSDGKEYDPWLAYGQAKTANILFAYGLGKKLRGRGRGVECVAVHPGYNGDTKLGEHLTWDDYGKIDGVMERSRGIKWEWEEPRFKTFSQIAATPLIAALDPALVGKTPAFMQNSRVHEADGHATDPEAAEKLWKLSEELVGQKFEY